MVIGAGSEDFAPWLRVSGLDAMFCGDLLDGMGSEAGDDVGEGLTEERVAESVDAFEVFEEEEEFFDVVESEFLVDVVEGVCDGVGDPLVGKVTLEGVDGFAGFLDVCVLAFGDAPCQDLDFAAVFGEVGCYFFTDEDIWSVCDFEAAGDGVVVCEGDELHAALFEERVEIGGFSATGREVEAPEDPFSGAMAELCVDLEIYLRRHGGCGGISWQGWR